MSSGLRRHLSHYRCLAPPAVAADLAKERLQTGLAFRPSMPVPLQAGHGASRPARLARVLRRGMQPATAAPEHAIELMQLMHCRLGCPNCCAAGRACQSTGPGAVAGSPAATRAGPLPSHAAVDGLARAWGRPRPLNDKMM